MKPKSGIETTTLPWKVNAGEKRIFGPAYSIAKTYGDNAEGDAALIVRAVNAHSDLLAACEAAIHDYQRMMALLEVHAKMSFKGGDFEAHLGQLRNAVIKAKGQS